MFNFFTKRSALRGRVSILIPTMFDSRYIIELALKSIWKNTDYPDYQIIVCDSGVDENTKDYLLNLVQQNEIRLIKTSDWERPKDDLVKAVDSEYYLLLHDDVRIFKKDWLSKRLAIMNRDNNNAIVGTIVKNYGRACRFFPLGLLVKTSVSKELDLKWGKQPGFDTGALAYNKFFSQDKYEFVPYKVSRDIFHFSNMTWPKYHTKEDLSDYEQKISEREAKISKIRGILKEGAY